MGRGLWRQERGRRGQQKLEFGGRGVLGWTGSQALPARCCWGFVSKDRGGGCGDGRTAGGLAGCGVWVRGRCGRLCLKG